MVPSGRSIRVTITGSLPSEQVAAHLAAADVIALPYRAILNSGSALYALSVGRPVIAPQLGSLPELAAEAGTDWVEFYEGEFSAEKLRSALGEAKKTLDLIQFVKQGDPVVTLLDPEPHYQVVGS